MKEHKEGFWKNKYEPTLPSPVANAERWIGQDEFVLKLKQVESKARGVAYRGSSTCRICNKLNGHEEYSYNDWVWPSGLMHYIVAHNVIPSEEFMKMINEAKNA